MKEKQSSLDYTQITFQGDRIPQASRMTDVEIRASIKERKLSMKPKPSKSRELGQKNLDGKAEIQVYFGSAKLSRKKIIV